MAAHRQLSVAEGDVGMNLAVYDESGDSEDVERPLTLDEGIPRRHVRCLHDVKVIAIERADPGKDGGVPDFLVLYRCPQREKHILAGIETQSDQSRRGEALRVHWALPLSERLSV